MSNNSFIPDVFVIGAMKGGTTTLYHVLKRPEICLTKEKEVNFFLADEPTGKINERYKKQIANAALIKCDVSPKYSQVHQFNGVAERIFKANPSAKIVYIVRDPIDRIISHLHHNLFRDRFNPQDLEKELKRHNEYLETSRYFRQISEYLRCFPKEQILILQMEELRKSPSALVKRLCEFLKIPLFTIGEFKSFYAAESRYKIKYFDFVHSNIKSRQLLKLYHYLWYFINIKPEKPTLKTETIAFLREALQQDVEALVREFSLDVGAWKHFGSQFNSKRT